MSLKVFHVVFIVLAIFCSFGFAAWTLLAEDVSVTSQVAGAVSAVLGLALVAYGYWFVTRKARKLIT